MGYDAYSYLLVGIKFKTSDILRSSKVKAFDHSFGEEIKFCPETGKPLWKNELVFLDGTPFCDNFLGLDVYHSCSEDDMNNPKTDLYVGKFIGQGANPSHSDRNYVFLSEDKIAPIRETVQKELQPFNLWRPGSFGIWSFLYESC